MKGLVSQSSITALKVCLPSIYKTKATARHSMWPHVGQQHTLNLPDLRFSVVLCSFCLILAGETFRSIESGGICRFLRLSPVRMISGHEDKQHASSYPPSDKAHKESGPGPCTYPAGVFPL